MNKTVILSSRKPRNPLVAAACLRQAGRHQPAGHSARQQAQRVLQRELIQLRPHSP